MTSLRIIESATYFQRSSHNVSTYSHSINTIAVVANAKRGWHRYLHQHRRRSLVAAWTRTIAVLSSKNSGRRGSESNFRSVHAHGLNKPVYASRISWRRTTIKREKTVFCKSRESDTFSSREEVEPSLDARGGNLLSTRMYLNTYPRILGATTRVVVTTPGYSFVQTASPNRTKWQTVICNARRLGNTFKRGTES